jgi:hypothetical protein
MMSPETQTVLLWLYFKTACKRLKWSGAIEGRGKGNCCPCGNKKAATTLLILNFPALLELFPAQNHPWAASKNVLLPTICAKLDKAVLSASSKS